MPLRFLRTEACGGLRPSANRLRALFLIFRVGTCATGHALRRLQVGAFERRAAGVCGGLSALATHLQCA